MTAPGSQIITDQPVAGWPVDDPWAPVPEAISRETYQPPRAVDWTTFLSEGRPPVDWFLGRFMARGQHIALVGDGKVGKSLLVQEWAWRASAGLPFLGDHGRSPLRIVYVDKENAQDDLRDRMIAFGATAAELKSLVYLPFPDIGPLDTPGGAAQLHAAIDYYRGDLVVLDTVSRMISGKENDSDTWLALYRYTVVPLKAAGLSSVRLDHFGKDRTKGARGNSAKTQDVDAVWELAHDPQRADGLSLVRTHTRTGKGPADFHVIRIGEQIGDDEWKPGATRHELRPPQQLGRSGANVPPARRKLLEALQAAEGIPTTGHGLVDWISATYGHGLTRQTVSRELGALLSAGVVDRIEPGKGRGREALWTLIDDGDRLEPDSPVAYGRGDVSTAKTGNIQLESVADTEATRHTTRTRNVSPPPIEGDTTRRRVATRVDDDSHNPKQPTYRQPGDPDSWRPAVLCDRGCGTQLPEDQSDGPCRWCAAKGFPDDGLRRSES